MPNSNDVLLVIDVQNDFCPGGALAVPGGDGIVGLANELIGRFDHVVLTQDWHPAGHSSFASSHVGAEPFSSMDMSNGAQTLWPNHCVQGTGGADFHSDLEWDKAELVVRKGFRSAIDSYSAFFENDKTTPTGLAGYLRERGFEHVFCCGLAFDYCVRFSAEDARSQGFQCSVIEDACRSIDLDGSKDNALSGFASAGVNLVKSGDLL